MPVTTHPLDWNDVSFEPDLPPGISVIRDVQPFHVLHRLLWGAKSSKFVHEFAVDFEPLAGDDDELDPPVWTIHWLVAPDSASAFSDRMAIFNHLVLLEYPALLSQINTEIIDYRLRARNRIGPHGTVIVGQPGIGKTQFLTYMLFKRLKDKKNTILWLPAADRYVFFHHNGVAAYDDVGDLVNVIQELGLEFKDVVLLYDASAGSGPPPSVWMREWWTVHSTSPDRSRYKEWDKQQGPVVYWMRPNIWDEVFIILRYMELCKPDMIDFAREAFCDAGPMLRHSIEAGLSGSSSLDNFIQSRDLAILSLITSSDLKLLVNNNSDGIGLLPPDKYSHEVFIAVPNLPSRRTARLQHASLAVSDKLLDMFCQQRAILAQETWNALTKVEGVGSFSGVMYEGAVRRNFVERRPLPDEGAMHALPYEDGSVNANPDCEGLQDAGRYVYRYRNLEDAVGFISEHLCTDCVLIPKAKNQATFDLFRVDRVDQKTVQLILYQITVGSSHDIKSTGLHDLWHIFHDRARFPGIDKVFFKLVFVVPPKAFDKWTTAVIPKNLTKSQVKRRMKKGEEVFDSEHWCQHLAQYVVCVDMDHLLDPRTTETANHDIDWVTGRARRARRWSAP